MSDQKTRPKQSEQTQVRPSRILQRKGEPNANHRAFVLWAMQDEDLRSVRAVATAMHRPEPTVRKWRRKGDWSERADHATAQAEAIRLYREKYQPRFNLAEVEIVEKNMSVAYLVGDLAPQPDAVAPSDRSQVSKARVQREMDRGDVRAARRRHVSLLDAAIGTVIEPLKKGKAKLSLRDLPTFIKLRDAIADELAPVATGKGSTALVESVRVRQARQSGGDLVAAMHEDAVELAAITGALVAAQEAKAARETEAGQKGTDGSDSDPSNGDPDSDSGSDNVVQLSR